MCLQIHNQKCFKVQQQQIETYCRIWPKIQFKSLYVVRCVQILRVLAWNGCMFIYFFAFFCNCSWFLFFPFFWFGFVWAFPTIQDIKSNSFFSVEFCDPFEIFFFYPVDICMVYMNINVYTYSKCGVCVEKANVIEASIKMKICAPACTFRL